MTQGFLSHFEKNRPTTSGEAKEITPAYADTALRNAIKEMESATEPGRNQTLNAICYGIAPLIRCGALDEDYVRDAMADAARAAGLEEFEIPGTVNSGIETGLLKNPKQYVLKGSPGVEEKAAQASTPAVGIAGPLDNPFGECPPMDAFEWMFKTDDTVVELWGKGDDILWADGEALMIAGGMGLGKSTLAGQLIRAQLGLRSEVLGLPVTPTDRPILLLGMDRPAQLRRSLRRQFSEAEQEIAAGRLLIRPGPPIMDMALDPTLLTRMAEAVGAGTVYVDSLKDAVVGLSGDEAAAMYNRGRQALLASGVNIVETHHCRKPSAESSGGIASVYGSTWLTSGAGSVIILSGEPGDLEIKFRHAKTPVNEVGPWKIHLNPDGGDFTVRKIDLLVSVKNAGAAGLTAEDAAKDIYESNRPTVSEKKKAERQLDRLVSKGLLTKIEGTRGAVWFLAENRGEAPRLHVVKDEGMFGE